MRIRPVVLALVLLGVLATGGPAAAGIADSSWLGANVASTYSDASGEADYSASSDVGLVVIDGGPSGPITINVSAAGEPTMRANSGFSFSIDTDRCKTTGENGFEYQIGIVGSNMTSYLYRWTGSTTKWQSVPAPSLTWLWDNGPKVTINGSEFGSPASFNFVLATSRVQNFGGGDFRPYHDFAPNLGTWVYPHDAAPVAPCTFDDPPPAADTKPPNTRLLASPSARTTGRSATFRFASSEARSTFRCKLDRRAWARCRSGVTYRRLARGLHTFRVRATDRAGNVDRTPARKTWRIA